MAFPRHVWHACLRDILDTVCILRLAVYKLAETLGSAARPVPWLHLGQ